MYVSQDRELSNVETYCQYRAALKSSQPRMVGASSVRASTVGSTRASGPSTSSLTQSAPTSESKHALLHRTPAYLQFEPSTAQRLTRSPSQLDNPVNHQLPRLRPGKQTYRYFSPAVFLTTPIESFSPASWSAQTAPSGLIVSTQNLGHFSVTLHMFGPGLHSLRMWP